MTRLLLALAAVLGWTAYAHLTRREPQLRLYGQRTDAFPYPTSDAIKGIDLADAAAIRQWCDTFGCTGEQLRAAVRHVGAVPSDVRMHLGRRR